ncbi:adenosylmethionine--8-amino-7-oxononanoate transaminase [Devriesea agamarum]|uniref:adenosylmethionine--8-amino-7-oxononanoate transaminase n=1 Tax=Devriesea agamarum TaxID=472569 RepID=UPI00071DC1FF|nr:adenosylmethionine--8-amino-7-oxononanoate transaminase [Devriesea agamarum]
MNSLIARDRGLLWHPYAPLDGPPLYEVTSAQGVRLTLRDANGSTHEVLDAMSSWWCQVHGYRHPVLDAAAHDQIDRFSHVMFGGLTHGPAVELAERLIRLTPNPLAHVFLADSGSVAVEVALKLCVQAQQGRGHSERTAIAAISGGYHGDTTGAMSICDPHDGMHHLFHGLVSDQVFLPRPPAPADGEGIDPDTSSDEFALWTAATRTIIDRHHHRLAAVFCEPVLQGAGGMRVYDPRCLTVLRDLCDEYGLLLVADEIATAFGRTGTLFGCDHAEVVPDIMCVGKALTGGYLTLAAVITTSEVADAIASSAPGALLHGPTFMGNPLACAVAGASLDLLTTAGSGSAWTDEVPRVEAALRTYLRPAAALSCVDEVRVLGAVGVIQLNRPADVPKLTAAAVRRGVWVRPFRNLVYTMPPYLITDDEVRRVSSGMIEAIAEVHDGS